MNAPVRTLKVRVRRGDDESQHFDEFEVPALENQTVLDVVTWIQRNADPALSYRFACRVGMCGSCAMTVNGKPRWTCRTHVSKVSSTDELVIEPLNNLPVIKDLATDMTTFFDKWTQAGGQFKPTKTRDDEIEVIPPSTPARMAADAGIECINCGVCYSACDAVAQNTDYLGPAALNRAWTLQNDERDSGQADRLAAVTGPGGCHSCHSQQGCVMHCPNSLNPTRSISGLKRAATIAMLKGNL